MTTVFEYHKVVTGKSPGGLSADLTVADLCKLGKLEAGTLLILDDGEQIFIGNGTPYEQPSTTSNDGWDWDIWDKRVVKELHKFVYTDGRM